LAEIFIKFSSFCS